MKEERKPCLHAHVKWFYGQSERAYYLNYFIIIQICSICEVLRLLTAQNVGKYGVNPFVCIIV